MKTLLIIPLLISQYLKLHAQAGEAYYAFKLDINNFNTTLDATGTVGYGSSHPNYFYAPADGIVSPLFGTWLWITATDQNGMVRDLCPNWYFDENEIKIGPFTNKYDDFGGYVPELIINKYNRVWKVSKEEINFHQLNWMNDEYIIPDGILNWPGNGDTSYGSAELLAPFTDQNGNYIYEPSSGDHPNIKGDVAIFAMYNDHGKNEFITENPVTDLEIHVMLYAYYDSPGSPLYNTIFVNYKIINRGSYNYHDLFSGIFSSFDLGAYDDDYVGCDSALDLMFTYNGDLIDGPTFPNYGALLPAFGVTSLSHAAHSFMFCSGDNTATGTPYNAIEKQRVMNATWKDGIHLTYGEDGYDTSPEAISTNFMFSGDPANTDSWSENSLHNAPADKRGYSSVGPFLLDSGDELCLDFAYIFAQPAVPEGNIAPVELLKNYTSQIHALYSLSDDKTCMENIKGSTPEITLPEHFSVFPNPGNGNITIESGLSEGSVFYLNVFNAKGQRMAHKTLVNAADREIHHIDLTYLAPGIYFMHFEIEGFEFTEKLVIK